jgi:hypothetical protein
LRIKKHVFFLNFNLKSTNFFQKCGIPAFYLKLLVDNSMPFQNAKLHCPTICRSRKKLFLSIPLGEKS